MPPQINRRSGDPARSDVPLLPVLGRVATVSGQGMCVPTRAKDRGTYRVRSSLVWFGFLFFMALVLANPAHAQGEIACPSRLTFTGLPGAPGTSAQAIARVDAQERLLCLYQGVTLQALTPRPASGDCQPQSLQPIAAGGTGAWLFGAPVGASRFILPVKANGAACLHGGASHILTGLIAWRESPPGTLCAVHPDSPSRFLCAPAGVVGGTAASMMACPPQLRADSLPPEEWNPTLTLGFYTPESLLLNAETGRLVQARLSQRQLRDAMGSAYPQAIFISSGPPFTAPGQPPGSYACRYAGPRFQRGRQSLAATIAIACSGPCTLR